MNSNSATTCRLPSWVVSLLVLMLLAGGAAAETVNINKASAEAMQEHLPGIGPAKSQAVVDYRKKHGSFKSADDLLQIPGIGEASLEKIRGNVSVNRGVTDASKGFKPRARSGTAAGSVTGTGGRKASDAAQGRKTGTAKSGAGAGDGKRESKDNDKAGKTTSTEKRAKKDTKTKQSEKQKQGAKQNTSAKKKSKKTGKAKTSSPGDKKSSGKKKSKKKKSTASKQ